MKSEDATMLEMPSDEKITVDWLKRHVPFRLWASLVVLLFGVFGAGVKVGSSNFVREFTNKTEEKGIQSMPSVISTPSPSLAEAKIEIRSPSNGAPVSGETTFAASAIGLQLSNYKMSWQVDNGQLNPMADSNESGPHKEAKVNVTSWNWKGKGPYVITFVVTSLNGSRITDRSLDIFVDNK